MSDAMEAFSAAHTWAPCLLQAGYRMLGYDTGELDGKNVSTIMYVLCGLLHH
jgi:hypothetical protein